MKTRAVLYGCCLNLSCIKSQTFHLVMITYIMSTPCPRKSTFTYNMFVTVCGVNKCTIRFQKQILIEKTMLRNYCFLSKTCF